MQEEVNQKTVALSIRTTKLTGKVLAAALGKVARAVQKHHRKALTPQGRQSVKKLMNHYGKLSEGSSLRNLQQSCREQDPPLYSRQKELAVQRHACRRKSQRSDLQHCGNSKGKQPCAQRLYPVPFRESA